MEGDSVCGVPSTICPISHCLLFFSSMRTLVSHWGNCQEPYVWYNYCTICSSQHKLAKEAVSHVHKHIVDKHIADVLFMQLATMARDNASRKFIDLQDTKP